MSPSATSRSTSHIEIDGCVPIRFRSYQGTIGAKYIRIGDFQTSLLELVLGSNEAVIRGLTLSLFEVVHEPEALGGVAMASGLPLVKLPADAKFKGSPYAPRLDIGATLSVGLGKDFAEVLISEAEHVDTLLCHGRIGFMLNAGLLTGIRVPDLTPVEVDTLAILVAEAKTRNTKTQQDAA